MCASSMHSTKHHQGCDGVFWPNQAHRVQARVNWLPAPPPSQATQLQSPPPRLHLGKHPNPPFPRSQALELQAQAMAARKTGSARVGRRRGRPHEKARITALLVISSPPPLLSSFFHLALAIFFSSPPFVTWSLVIEIHGTVTGEYCLPLPPAHLTSVFICSDSVPNIRVLLLSLSHSGAGDLESGSDLVSSSLLLQVNSISARICVLPPYSPPKMVFCLMLYHFQGRISAG
jgi:hypothetical protein